MRIQCKRKGDMEQNSSCVLIISITLFGPREFYVPYAQRAQMSVILIHVEIKQEKFKYRSLRMKGKSCMSASSKDT